MRALLVLLLMTPALAHAQEGTVRYEETIRIEIELPPEMAHMQDQFPDTRTDVKLLFFDPSASLMTDAPEEETDDEVDVESGGRRIRMMRRQTDDRLYTHFDEATVVEQRDFMGRTFLITGTPEALPWRLTGEQGSFLGYACQKAVTTRDSLAVEAWFTPEIPVPAGPAGYGGLPGLILVLTEDGGRRSFVAKDVALEAVPEAAIVRPEEGRPVTREEFTAIVEEKMEEMSRMRGGRGRGIVIRR